MRLGLSPNGRFLDRAFQLLLLMKQHPCVRFFMDRASMLIGFAFGEIDILEAN
jgi:hypothetical protein